ncbi:MAG: monovalent cation/H+ antiporter complex subunit F [Wenzhouxiangellaceae bacterium]
MDSFLMGAALFLLVNLGVGLTRLYRGPEPADRVQALLLFTTTTVAMLLLLAHAEGSPALIHVALVFVMLAAIASIAFVQLPHRIPEE